LSRTQYAHCQYNWWGIPCVPGKGQRFAARMQDLEGTVRTRQLCALFRPHGTNWKSIYLHKIAHVSHHRAATGWSGRPFSAIGAAGRRAVLRVVQDPVRHARPYDAQGLGPHEQADMPTGHKLLDDLPGRRTNQCCRAKYLFRRRDIVLLAGRQEQGRLDIGDTVTRMRASSAITPWALASSGLMSSSAISGTSMTSRTTWIRVRQIASPTAFGRLRYPDGSFDMRVRETMSRARTMFRGGRPTAWSALTFTATPPCPNRMTGPNTGSVVTPTINSCACARRTMAWTENPRSRAPGCRRDRRWCIASTARSPGAAGGTCISTPWARR